MNFGCEKNVIDNRNGPSSRQSASNTRTNSAHHKFFHANFKHRHITHRSWTMEPNITSWYEHLIPLNDGRENVLFRVIRTEWNGTRIRANYIPLTCSVYCVRLSGIDSRPACRANPHTHHSHSYAFKPPVMPNYIATYANLLCWFLEIENSLLGRRRSAVSNSSWTRFDGSAFSANAANSICLLIRILQEQFSLSYIFNHMQDASTWTKRTKFPFHMR